MSPSILAGADRMELENGMSLRLLSALEVLEARREADELARSPEERPLCRNACLLARALESREGTVFASGREVLGALRLEEIAALAGRWSDFNRRENPSLDLEETGRETLKKN